MKTLRVNLTGDPGTSSYCAITFPTALLGGPYVCQLVVLLAARRNPRQY
jgi:hypothetical protein